MEDMEFLKGIFNNNITTFKKLKQECSELKENFKEKKELHQKLWVEHCALQQINKELNEQNIARELERNNEDEVATDMDSEKITDDSAEKMQQHSFILGYRVANFDINTQLVTLHYNEHFYVQFKTSEQLELQQIYPKHPNFDAIKTMLYETNDIAGLLAVLRKYFDLILTTQIEENKACVK